MFISAFSVTNTNPVTKMKVCYLATLYAALHVNYNKYTFSKFRLMLRLANRLSIERWADGFNSLPKYRYSIKHC